MPKIKHPQQPAVMVGKTLRYKENKIVRAGATDLNRIMLLPFSNDDRRQFWKLLGYSLSGYADLDFAERDCPMTLEEARNLTTRKIPQMPKEAVTTPPPVPNTVVCQALDVYKKALRRWHDAARGARAAMGSSNKISDVEKAERASADAQLQLSQAKKDLDSLLLDD